MAFALLVLIVAGGMAYIRLAPSDLVRWHVAPELSGGSGWTFLPPGADAVVAGRGRAKAAVAVLGKSPAEVLSDLDAIALNTARTVRLAGSPEEGMITWVTRSRVFGFPDYTTAAARDEGPATALTLHARLRFGRDDQGVNASRLRDWLGQLTPR
ncbi:DUF1499 domain-containing protein [Defluviimonas aestuarii]|uniref:DUF1499 domain-containing protein n=1 Tax=Albidovulum aestuarii TaxID=1130726 RepID=UPI003014E84A